MDPIQYNLPQSRIPRAWYNILPDLPKPLAPVLHPGTLQFVRFWRKHTGNVPAEFRYLIRSAGLHTSIVLPKHVAVNMFG